MRDSRRETLSGIVHLHRRDCTGMGPSTALQYYFLHGSSDEIVVDKLHFSQNFRELLTLYQFMQPKHVDFINNTNKLFNVSFSDRAF